MSVHLVRLWSNESTACGLAGQDYLTDEQEEVTCPECKDWLR